MKENKPIITADDVAAALDKQSIKVNDEIVAIIEVYLKAYMSEELAIKAWREWRGKKAIGGTPAKDGVVLPVAPVPPRS